MRQKVIVHKCAETIQGRKLYEEIRYIYFSLWNMLDFNQLKEKNKRYANLSTAL